MIKASPKSERREVLGRVQRSYPRMRRVVVPLDFSGKSRQALGLAAPIASKFGARLVLVHVLAADKSTAAERKALSLPANTARRTAAHRRLRETALQFVGEELIDQTIVRAGRPAKEIVEIARELDADLLAITTQGKNGFGRLLKGSTAEQVLRLAPCPVLTVRKK